ncbi:MAG: hypothetical protein WC156_11945 [Pedobacter sp.]
MIVVHPSDLNYKYPKDVEHREQLKFKGKPDPHPFNRNDLYEVVPMMTAAMNELGSDEGRVLHMLEDILNFNMPRCINSREEVFDFLVETARG